jgi:hypothetical protein
MALPDNAVQTVAMVGIRESLVDDINILTKAEALFYNACGAGKKPKAVKHEFMTDTIRAGADNGAVEGDNLTAVASTQPARIYNNCQIQTESYAISSTSNAVTAAGRTTEKETQRRKHMLGLARDMEYAVLRGVRVEPAAGVAGKMRGALNWITSNLNKAGDAVLAADGTVAGGTARPLDATILKGVLQNIFTAGGGRKTLTAWLNVFQQSQFDAMLTINNNRQMVEKGKIDDYVDIYKTAFGSIKAEVNIEMPADQVMIADMAFWKKCILEEMGEKEVGVSILNQKWDMATTWTLEASNELASGRATDLTTA